MIIQARPDAIIETVEQEEFLKVVENICGIPAGSRIVVGVSGGADSTLLAEWLHRSGYQVVACHYDHNLRPNSVADAEVVRQAAAERGWQFVLGTAAKGQIEAAKGKSVEMAARDERYGFLFRTAESLHAAAVAVGHTADDQAETVLMHIIRGSGLDGLRGMTFRSLTGHSLAIPLIRPFLAMTHAEVEQECHQLGLSPVMDETNLTLKYQRHRIRRKLLPLLEAENPRIKQALCRLADNAANDIEIIERAVDAAWQACSAQSDGSRVTFSLNAFIQQPQAIQKRLLMKAVSILRPGKLDLSSAMISRALKFIHQPLEANRIQWGLNLGLRICGHDLIIFDRKNVIPAIYPSAIPNKTITVVVPGITDLKDGWVIEADWVDRIRPSLPVGWEMWMGEDLATMPIMVRTPLAADEFAPFGMQGKHVRLGDFLTNQKIPIEVRHQWPLVVQDEKIIWVTGLRAGELTRTEPGQALLLRLRLMKT